MQEETKKVYENERVQVFKGQEYLFLFFKQPHRLRIKVNDRQAIDDEVIRMLRMCTTEGKRYFAQAVVGKIIGVSRQMINRRWQVYLKEGLVNLLRGEQKKKSTITRRLLDRLAEIVVENPFLFVRQIKERLQSEGVCGEIRKNTLYKALRRMDGRRLIMLMRRKAKKQVPEAFMEAGYLIERLFSIIEQLFSRVGKEAEDRIAKQNCYEYLKCSYRRSVRRRVGPTEKDKYYPRKKLVRDRKRNVGFLRRLIEGILPTEHCPDCDGTTVQFIFRRARSFTNKTGEKIADHSRVYRCQNHECPTNYFTVPPKGVELYARVNRDVKKMTFRWIFHLRGSLSKVCDELIEHGIKVALTTVMRWLKKAGEECVEVLSLNNEEDRHQPLCIDEKWIKVRNKWHYVFTAVGTRVTDLLAIELFFHKDSQAIRTFLLGLKAQGYRPTSVTTDLLLGYENAVKEVFPECIFHQCVLHAERDAKRIVRENLPKDAEEVWKKRLTRSIRVLFASRKIKQVKKRYLRFLRLRHAAPQATSAVFDMVERYYPKLCQSVLRKDIPRTTNAVERAIGEFEDRYHLTKGFSSFYNAQFFLKAFQTYYRLRKIHFGRFRGRNRLQLKGNPVGKLTFADYLTPSLM